MNIVSYGFKADGNHFMEVSLTVAQGLVRTEVVDDGIAFNPLLSPDPDTTLGVEDREIGGLGLFLVKKLMDKVEYERRDNLNNLKFTKDCSAKGASS